MNCVTCDRELPANDPIDCPYCCNYCGEDIPDGTGEKVVFWYCKSCYQTMIEDIGRHYDELRERGVMS